MKGTDAGICAETKHQHKVWHVNTPHTPDATRTG
jgi:hypothetical protein